MHSKISWWVWRWLLSIPCHAFHTQTSNRLSHSVKKYHDSTHSIGLFPSIVSGFSASGGMAWWWLWKWGKAFFRILHEQNVIVTHGCGTGVQKTKPMVRDCGRISAVLRLFIWLSLIQRNGCSLIAVWRICSLNTSADWKDTLETAIKSKQRKTLWSAFLRIICVGSVRRSWSHS